MTTSKTDAAPAAVRAREPVAESRPSIGELISEVSEDIATLLRKEVELAKAEIRQSANRAGKGVGMFAGAGVAGHMVLLFLSIAAWWGIGDATGHGWSGLIVAVVWLTIAAILAVVGRGELKKISGVPRTTETAKKIPDALKGHEESTNEKHGPRQNTERDRPYARRT